MRRIIIFSLLITTCLPVVWGSPYGLNDAKTWAQLTGRVVSSDGQNLVLEDHQGRVRHIHVDKHVQIFHWWRLVDLRDLQPEDRIVLRHDSLD